MRSPRPHLRLLHGGGESPPRRVRHSVWPLLVMALPLATDSRVLGEGGPGDRYDWKCPVCKNERVDWPLSAPSCRDCKLEMQRVDGPD